ncbi:ankyrin repeat and fibronectin type-III domain-containing protein 1 isoform X1 [Hemibagrus wyckioides]|uniref:ankyrin repeat and fibronectin type-III domain-containing protein 1 isoform X1 n=1 Tax=Hemibagrus wyckioides TaxID=337641 RepID=UPI00266D11BD|nr:ankyrin repeat and fibronectin type-III domain-containing protein 1 isoform X1 [Hemibagrus wyckioides]XP_058255136.1 ankyrin repeat and fibronectin type-III domain-containing protein 1 isoform X1 [Hemibagrus wyckioides]XP_058255146.1 ankyrin repeat and fibronectin type-III domain-containing protein 1 isoform X1 [Hemibagrus wyckioides]
MTERVLEHCPAAMRKYSSSSCSSPPNAARRLYRNLSGKFRMANSDETDSKEQLRKANAYNRALFEAVEQQDLDLVESILKNFSVEELDLNTPNSEGLLPLDIAILTNNVPMAKLLLQRGAKESPHFVSPEARAVHLVALVKEAELRVSELAAQVKGTESTDEGADTDRERQLKAWEWRLRLYKRMQTGYTHTSPPDPPSCVRLSISSSSSLKVNFQEPLCLNAAIITKYRVVWSSSPSFSPLLGEIVIEDTTLLQFDITGLQAGVHYYVQVFAYNMKGWSEPQISVPACATPSGWRDVDGREPRLHSLSETLLQILGQIKESHQHCVCHDHCKGPSNVRKHSVSKSLRHFFQPTSKFIKCLKRGLYIACVFYKDDNILVTAEEQLPIIEVDDSYSSLTQDFLWFTKVTYLWEEILWLQQCASSTHPSCSCTLQTRLKILQALTQLQALLGTQDLGQVYFEPLRDKHGNALLVLLRDLGGCSDLDTQRWSKLGKLQLQRKSTSCADEPTALDTLLITLHEKLVYHKRSRKMLSPGLYLGYMKLSSSVEQIRVLVPQKIPNVFCHVKIRDNSHVSREEWQWLQSVHSLDDTQDVYVNEQNAAHRLLLELRNAANDLLGRINVPNNQASLSLPLPLPLCLSVPLSVSLSLSVSFILSLCMSQAQDFRIYVQDVLEFGEGVSFLLFLPPYEEVCTPPGQSNFSPRSGFFTLPLQIFELVHFGAYCPTFIGQYCRVSASLDLESLISQQALREAFSESELLTAKQRHQKIQELLQQVDEVWREARWMVEVLQFARYKQQQVGVNLGSIIDFSKENIVEKTPSTSSQPDYLPSPAPSPVESPAPSPDSGRKYPDPLSDDEGSLEVFLTPDSDYSSSPRELDLLAPSHPLPYTHTLDQPDVLCSGGGVRAGPELIDSDFVLPSRQIELLRITEKKTALCVRTSSLETPPTPSVTTPSHSPAKVWARPGPIRSLSEDSGRKQNSSHCRNPTYRSCYSTVRVYPQYHTGLPKETSVKLRVTIHTTAREMVQLVVQEINGLCARLQSAARQCVCPAQVCVCGTEVCVYASEQLDHFALVLLTEGREKWLQDDFCPLTLQNPWTHGRLCVRFKQYSPLALQHGRATAV